MYIIRPALGRASVVDPNDDLILVNEIFAITVACNFLNFVPSVDKFRELLYDLFYRDLSEDALLLFFQTMQDIHERRSSYYHEILVSTVGISVYAEIHSG